MPLHVCMAIPCLLSVTFAHTLSALQTDAQGLRWEAQSGKPGMTNTYLSFMKAAYKIDPSECCFRLRHVPSALPTVAGTRGKRKQ